MLLYESSVHNVVSKVGSNVRWDVCCITIGDLRHIRIELDLLALDFGEYQPAVVPATSAGWIADDLPFGLV